MPIKFSEILFIFVYLSVFLRNSHMYFQDTGEERWRSKKEILISTLMQLEVEENSDDTTSKGYDNVPPQSISN